MERTQPLEIKICPIHHVDGTRFRLHGIEDIHVMQLDIGDVDERKDIL